MRILLIILLISPSLVNAQAPGYMGKKTLLHYNFHFFPALSSPNANMQQGITSFNTQHHILAEYVLDRKNALGLNIRFYNTTQEMTEDLEYENTTNPFDNSTIHHTPDNHILISATHIGIVWKHYYKHLAPLGPYHHLEGGMTFHSPSIPTKSLTYQPNGPFGDTYSADVTNNSPYKNLYGSYKFGQQSILFNVLVIDYGIEFTYVLGGIGALIESSSVNNFNYLQRSSEERIFNHNLINLSLGIGFLAF